MFYDFPTKDEWLKIPFDKITYKGKSNKLKYIFANHEIQTLLIHLTNKGCLNRSI